MGDFNACTLLAPDFAWPYLNRGLSLARSAGQEDAVASYDRALALSPDFVEALVNRALACLELNEPARAERDLGRAVGAGPSRGRAYWRRGPRPCRASAAAIEAEARVRRGAAVRPG